MFSTRNYTEVPFKQTETKPPSCFEFKRSKPTETISIVSPLILEGSGKRIKGLTMLVVYNTVFIKTENFQEFNNYFREKGDSIN